MRITRDNRRAGPRIGGSRLYALLAVNGVLLLLLAVVSFAPASHAQDRARGKYTMAGGNVNGAQSGAVYIVDTVNRELMAITFDPNQKNLFGLGFRDLSSDIGGLTRGSSR